MNLNTYSIPALGFLRAEESICASSVMTLETDGTRLQNSLAQMMEWQMPRDDWERARRKEVGERERKRQEFEEREQQRELARLLREKAKRKAQNKQRKKG